MLLYYHLVRSIINYHNKDTRTTEFFVYSVGNAIPI